MLVVPTSQVMRNVPDCRTSIVPFARLMVVLLEVPENIHGSAVNAFGLEP
jgi:hypothetical protein